jgi:hypothetical protein
VICVSIAWLCGASRALALETPPAPAERVRLVYDLGVDCPAPDALARELDARLGPGWQAPPNELARTITISEEVLHEHYTVRVEYTDASLRRVTREVNANTCDEASSMTAVVVTIAIDALARERATPPPEVAPNTPVTPPPTPPGKSMQAPAEPRAAAQPRHPSFVHEAGLRFGVTSGFGTRAALGPGAEWGMVRPSGFAIRAALEARTTGNAPAADARARFSAVTARGDVCIVALKLTPLLGIPVCGGLEAGVLWAKGVTAPPAVTTTRASTVPWVAGLVTPRLRIATARAYAELVPELRLPFVGHTFTFESPERQVYTLPPAAFGVALAAGVRFQ